MKYGLKICQNEIFNYAIRSEFIKKTGKNPNEFLQKKEDPSTKEKDGGVLYEKVLNDFLVSQEKLTKNKVCSRSMYN
tara:strand:- start:1059 stop:1289 length:231 start_codon:yes stop_codon:yes gene_type:complete